MKVVSVNISEKKGTIKKPVDVISLDPYGVQEDAHAGDWHRQVSLLGVESIRRFEEMAGRRINYGEFAENITTTGITLFETAPLDRLFIGDTELEITQIGKKCHGDSCAIFREVGNCVMPKEGIFARVLKAGRVTAGAPIEYHPKVFKIGIITLSDRASKQVYEDRSGPKAEEIIREFFMEMKRKAEFTGRVIPDDEIQLENLLREMKENGTDIVFTTGGTGIGPRDITPDVARRCIDKELPGIMELIRFRYGQDKPGALLSRAVAGTMGNTLLFTLPGSVKAVNEYLAEIKKILMHAIYMIHRLDIH
ncbi:MAG: MOSC domain-containing protein [Bacteroidales bacterium]|nr:MOSC domain-containing protein [Bacteroidales bacterium]